jgi:hypothetical protein
MPKRTLYVSDEDEKVWEEAQKLSADGDESLSKLATAALRERIAIHRQVQAEDQNGGDIVVSIKRAEHRTVTGKIRSLIDQFGRERVAIAFARACSIESAERSRARQQAAEAKRAGRGVTTPLTKRVR